MRLFPRTDSASAGQRGALGVNRLQQVLPGFDEGARALLLQTDRKRFEIDSGLRETR